MRGLSPRQLWLQGLLMNYDSGHRITEEVYHGAQADNYVSIIYQELLQ